jgi:hypothetical protein
MKTKRNLSGIYFRSKNEVTNKWDNVCFEDLSADEQHIILTIKDKGFTERLAQRLADTLNEIGEEFNIEKQ